jgi:cytosine/adenosine deaminase-related metal-dependent hydrolase
VSELLLRGAHVVAMDDAGSEHPDGWVLMRDGLIAAVGGGQEPAAGDRLDLGGALVTPGLVNTHHHLYQTLTRARAQESTLFEWLVELYPVWAGLDAEAEYAAARTGLAELALSGCSTVFDHHYVFPRGRLRHSPKCRPYQRRWQAGGSPWSKHHRTRTER